MMDFILGMQINIKLILSFWECVTRYAQSTQNKFAYLATFPEKHEGGEVDFCLQINTKIFCKLIVSLWVCIARYAQNTQSNKFTISLQYLKENTKEEVDFLPADKLQKFLQSDIIILDVCGQACPNYPK